MQHTHLSPFTLIKQKIKDMRKEIKRPSGVKVPNEIHEAYKLYVNAEQVFNDLLKTNHPKPPLKIKDIIYVKRHSFGRFIKCSVMFEPRYNPYESIKTFGGWSITVNKLTKDNKTMMSCSPFTLDNQCSVYRD